MIKQLESALRALSAGSMRPAAHHIREAIGLEKARQTETNAELRRIMAAHQLTRRKAAALLNLPQSTTKDGRWICGTLAAWLAPVESKTFRTMPAAKLALLRRNLES